ncbi:hypothetical protein RB195_001119 [Necator americanus]|uniref:Uncharacterized protein n=1 Tax=Necator americanus TaxID=51031 RepID=A0ABR1DCV7_NECAM
MGRHKRIPTKNRKKLKSVDPFNKNGASLRALALSTVNWEPNDEDQPMSRCLRELQESKKETITDKKDVKRRKQRKNKVLAEAEKAGIRKGRFETVEHFVRRVERMTFAAVKEHETLIKQGLVGRKESEIEADFKLLEEKEKAQREQKRNEIQNKIKAARKIRNQTAKIKEETLKTKERMKSKRNAEEKAEDEAGIEEMQENDNVMDGAQSCSATIDGSNLQSTTKRRKLCGSDWTRKMKLARTLPRQEVALNQREVIRFGERYDAPPIFQGMMKKEMDPLMAKAGSRNLLLCSLLQKQNVKETKYLEEEKRREQEEIDRQRVIEAYRELKRKKGRAVSSDS